VFCRFVGDLHLYAAVCIARVLLFYQQIRSRDKTVNWLISHIGQMAQAGVKRYPNLVPVADLALRLIAGIQMSALEIAEVPDVMRGAIGTDNPERTLTPAWKLDAPRKDHVEDHAVALVRLAPHTEVVSELVAQRTILTAVGPNRQTNGCG
jgi:hypothetical protein